MNKPVAEVVAEELKLNTPTVKYEVVGDNQKTGWMISTCSLGCGSRIFQGWSEGLGIDEKDNAENFERKFFTLLYLSKPANYKYTKDRWTSQLRDRMVEAPIGVRLFRYQFLMRGVTYTFNSLETWTERLEAFIKKHNLGDVSIGHRWQNNGYRGHWNRTGTWTWNGNVPKSADVGITDWKLPE